MQPAACATRRRRSWSSPCTSLAHLQHLSCIQQFTLAEPLTEDQLDTLYLRLFPTGSGTWMASEAAGLPVPLGTGAAAAASASESAGAAPAETKSSPMPDPAVEGSRELREELEASRLQIGLLNRANEQTLSLYRELDQRFRELQERHAALSRENDELRETLRSRDEEIDDQLHLICSLERQLDEAQAKFS